MIQKKKKSIVNKDLKKVLIQYVENKITKKDLYKWADFIEMREDINYEEVSDYIFLLANPDINGEITIQDARNYIIEMDNREVKKLFLYNMKNIKTPIIIGLLSLVIFYIQITSLFSLGEIINTYFPCEQNPMNSFPCFSIYDVYFLIFLIAIFLLSLGLIGFRIYTIKNNT